MAKRVRKKDAACGFAIQAGRIADEDNAEEINILDLREISPITDYFVICTGTSDRQMRTVADDICRHGKSTGQNVWHVAGTETAEWIVLDFVDVIVHIFDRKHRNYYDLELMWGEAPRVDWADKS